VTYRLGVFRADDDEPQVIAAVGHWVHVYIDKSTRRPIPIPDDIRALLSTAGVSEAPERSR
jgi:acyl-CoA thioester hydrolase